LEWIRYNIKSMIPHSYKIDFHTHSILSHDGGINEKDYSKTLTKGVLDYIAITDHNTIDFALFCRKKLGERIIIGEEITTNQGEIIGLFLTKPITPFQTLEQTIATIKMQGGLVYIPHPYDIRRSGIGEKNMEKIKRDISIVEIFNARMVFPSFNRQAKQFSIRNNLSYGCGSDAHNGGGLGYAYTIINQKVEKGTLVQALKNSMQKTTYLPFWQYGMPFLNRLKHYGFW